VRVLYSDIYLSEPVLVCITGPIFSAAFLFIIRNKSCAKDENTVAELAAGDRFHTQRDPLSKENHIFGNTHSAHTFSLASERRVAPKRERKRAQKILSTPADDAKENVKD